MNELQIRLSADITALKSALTKAKNTIKSFESETEKESEKGNVGFKRKIGLIEQLTNKAKALRTALSQATNETQVAKYNAQLEETSRELTRLNALGRSVTANLGSTAGGFGRVAKEGKGANAVALEFNRVIQDSPFGLLGIGNNLQQLATQFSSVSKSAGGAGKAIAQSFTALISPVNLGLLAISALTAGFTAYQMGAFDGIFATEDVGKAAEEAAEKLEDYRESLDAVTKATIEGSSQGQKEIQNFQLLKAQAENANIPLKTRIEAVKELQTTFPDYLSNLTQEQILTGNVGTAYEDLTNQIIATAKARAFSDQIAKNSLETLTIEQRAQDRITQILSKRTEIETANALAQELQGKAGETARIEREAAIGRAIRLENEILDLSKEQISDVLQLSDINSDNLKLQESITQQISQGAKFTEDQTKKAKELKDEFESLRDILPNLIISIESEFSQANFAKNIAKVFEGPKQKPVIDFPINFNIIPETADIDDSKLTDFVLRLKEFNDQIAGVLEEGAERSLGDFAFAIGDALGKGTNVLEASGAALLGGLASILNQLGQLAIGTGIAIAGIKKALQTLNPAVAIGAGVALIALAGFVSSKARALGGGSGGGGFAGAGSSGGGSASSGAPPQIFTNSQIPFIPSNPAPSPSGNIDFDKGQGRLTTTVSGGDIVFVYEREKERQQGGG